MEHVVKYCVYQDILLMVSIYLKKQHVVFVSRTTRKWTNPVLGTGLDIGGNICTPLGRAVHQGMIIVNQSNRLQNHAQNMFCCYPLPTVVFCGA